MCRARADDVTGGTLVVHQIKSGKVSPVPVSGALAAEIRLTSQRYARIADDMGKREFRRVETGVRETGWSAFR